MGQGVGVQVRSGFEGDVDAARLSDSKVNAGSPTGDEEEGLGRQARHWCGHGCRCRCRRRADGAEAGSGKKPGNIDKIPTRTVIRVGGGGGASDGPSGRD